ncbi:hypothetical protein BDM02DRAFT_2891182 [Thelephora ganbajun]|uniref:Uncharacterized protein n=1 Tax=Thelephora ganbajun TaxID=370292 RepID=A0ACB6ZAT0_THEGA|nr:hypothetical protein BDM02DRAFT_2891182 [Thelephora ganbajun]
MTYLFTNIRLWVYGAFQSSWSRISSCVCVVVVVTYLMVNTFCSVSGVAGGRGSRSFRLLCERIFAKLLQRVYDIRRCCFFSHGVGAHNVLDTVSGLPY